MLPLRVVMRSAVLDEGAEEGEGRVGEELEAELDSMEERGVPVVISVETEVVMEERVVVAAEERAEIMEGPGKMCAFVMCAQWAMRRGPAVYCFWTVPGVGGGG